MIVIRVPSGLAVAAEAAASGKIRAGEPGPELGSVLAARRAAAEIKTSPTAVAPGKRKAGAGVAGGSQKRKKSSPVKIKDL